MKTFLLGVTSKMKFKLRGHLTIIQSLLGFVCKKKFGLQLAMRRAYFLLCTQIFPWVGLDTREDALIESESAASKANARPAALLFSTLFSILPGGGTVFRAYSWLYVQDSLLDASGEPYAVPGINSGSVTHRVNMSYLLYYGSSPVNKKLFWYDNWERQYNWCLVSKVRDGLNYPVTERQIVA